MATARSRFPTRRTRDYVTAPRWPECWRALPSKPASPAMDKPNADLENLFLEITLTFWVFIPLLGASSLPTMTVYRARIPWSS